MSNLRAWRGPLAAEPRSFDASHAHSTMSAGEPKSRQGKASARGIWWDFSSGSASNRKLHRKPSCQESERFHCRAEMSRSSTSPALGTARGPSPADSTSSSTSGKADQVVVGVCAMNGKTLAPPMQSILSRLQHYDYIKIVVFSDTIILKDRMEDWPLCDCLLAFFSEGFPLQKAVDYVKLRRPFVFNDLDIQFTLQDRSEVYEILKQSGIRVPRYAVLRRPNDELSEPTKDTIEVNGEVFHKPFVEKPLSAEDHNVHIYFPSDYGGGCQKLFRKIGNRSSSYCSESRVRRDGSYIYEEFLATDGVDVKVYTVGPDYAHAEARKCPSLDGIVQRDDKGLEKRFPVILTAEEKLMARQVSLAFKQTVCGFDLLRSNGKSYVCDVNGFSFVKKSEKYYDDCAQILLEIITSRFAPEYFPNIPPSVEYLAEDVPVPIPKTDNNKDQLRCVIGIIRHGDRTPKQKMKMIVSHKKFYQLFEEMNGYATGHIRIKEPQKMQQLLDITRSLLEHPKGVEEEVHKLQQLKTVLEMYGYFSGINRKVQFKLVTHRPTPTSPKGQGLLLILKWGGELTAAGQRQAEELGRAFRCMYPGGEGEYASLPGSGFLRLHSTYRHDLKVYASDEGRVQMTAAAFTKGLLDLEGSLASVRTHLVKRDQHATDLLDTSNGADDIIRSVKEDLHLMMRSAEDFTEDSYKTLAPTRTDSILTAMRHVRNPRIACELLYQQIKSLTAEIRTKMVSQPNIHLYAGESLGVMLQRWSKLEKDFKGPDDQFDISKIPDIYDCVKFDLLHNRLMGLDQNNLHVLFDKAMYLADIVIPQEYGVTREEKLAMAEIICNPLLNKMQSDLHHVLSNESSDINHRLDPRLSKHIVISPSRHVRTRLYFTSESHIHCLINILRYSRLFGVNPDAEYSGWKKLSGTPELNFLSQIVILLYEDESQPKDSDSRYYIHLHIGSGVKARKQTLSEGVPFIDGDMHSPPSFVKRLPTLPTNRGSDSVVVSSATPPPSSRVVRKIASYPTMHYMATQPIAVVATPPHHRKSSTSFSGGGMSRDDSVLLKISPDSPGRKLTIGYTNESLQTLGEPGLVMAAELSSTVEPLTHVATLPGHKFMDFVGQFKGHRKFTKSDMYTPRPEPPNYQPPT